MKSLIGILLILTVIQFSCSTDGTTDVVAMDNKLPKELKNLPTGIEVSHSKKIVYAEINEKDPEKRGKYKWHYETTIKSTNEDLLITEFGAYVWMNETWCHNTVYDRPFNNEEFEKWYSCRGGELIKGKGFTDVNNWSKGSNLDGKTVKTLWYYIGVNKKGEKFKGTAEITSIHKFENKMQSLG